MTQPAVPEAVKASFAGEHFRSGANSLRLSRRGDEFWVELFGGGEDATGRGTKLRETRIVMTTGSHHMQGFWVARGRGNLLDQLPLMWLMASDESPGRWVPIADSFLTSPGSHFETPWNVDCIFCHSVFGKPRLDFQNRIADTHVVELGIACEACHGPGKEHVEARKASHTRTDPKETIVHPARLEPARSAAVCGHCHAVAKFANNAAENDWNLSGTRYRPGDDLELTRSTLSPSRLTDEQLASLKNDTPEFWESHYWPDGMVRVVGREYNGLIESACYKQGGMTCLSCHSMHRSDPNDQLAKGMDTNEACYRCHAEYRASIEQHTHHRSDSTGSLCYNCHMPHTTYGLFKAVRSHQISSPSVATTIDTGRPNACNLCHLDSSSSWTAAQLTEWYGQPQVELDEDRKQVSEAVLLLLRGDAVQRATVAYAFGQPAARQAAGDNWQAPLLAPLLEDPYSAVRLIAHRSLQRLDYDIDYDFLAAAAARKAARQSIIDRWRGQQTAKTEKIDTVLVWPDGSLDEQRIQRLLSERDDRPILIAE